MKKFYPLFLLLFSFSFCFAQLSYNYKSYSIGAGGGLATAFADVAKTINKPVFFASFSYNYTPYITFTAAYQNGKLAGGDVNADKDKRAFQNNFNAIILYGDLQIGELVDYRRNGFLSVIKNFYGGAGFGVIYNNLVSVQRNSLIEAGYTFPGRDKSTELMLDFRFGYEFKLYNFYNEPGICLRIGAETNLAYGEGLDGYNDPPTVFKNRKVDRYTMLSVGLRYRFGNPVSYRKPIRGNY